ncbi:hypothetical protein B4901_18240 [Yersinia frederiksenii]|nr:hypothetical protein B4901_18240 [Yersinia frederiksenii]
MIKDHPSIKAIIFECLILINSLIVNKIFKKSRIRTTGAEAASALACHQFSIANAQGYPQEWWITPATP